MLLCIQVHNDPKKDELPILPEERIQDTGMCDA